MKKPAYFLLAFVPALILISTGEMLDLIDGGAWEENIPKNMAPVLKEFLNRD